MSYHNGQANLELTPATQLSEGYYQCIAENQYGKSMSAVAQIIIAGIVGYVALVVFDVSW